jgi:hypothetical protein
MFEPGIALRIRMFVAPWATHPRLTARVHELERLERELQDAR